MDRLDQIRLNN